MPECLRSGDIVIGRVVVADGACEFADLLAADLKGLTCRIDLAEEVRVERHHMPPSWPPVTGIVTPEMKSASLDTRNACTLAMSSGTPSRPSAMSIRDS